METSDQWCRRRQDIIKRDGGECQYCSTEEGLEVHHLRPKREFDSPSKANHPANLVTLCTDCHRRLEPYSPSHQRTALAKYGVDGDIRGLEFRTDKEYLSEDAPEPSHPPDTEHERMTRALLTDGERAAVRDDQGIDDSTKSSHLSRVRGKMDRMEEDARLLRRHRPELYKQLRDAVVEEELDERIKRLEREVEDLREQLDNDEYGTT